MDQEKLVQLLLSVVSAVLGWFLKVVHTDVKVNRANIAKIEAKVGSMEGQIKHERELRETSLKHIDEKLEAIQKILEQNRGV